jgi:hypothetical protein
MKKVIVSLSALLLIVGATKAQDKNNEGFHFGAGIQVAIPTGDLGDVAGVGFGPKIQGEFKVSENFSVVGAASYNFFTKKNEVSTTVLPIQAGIRYYIASGFFVGAEVGYTNVHTKVTFAGQSASGSTGAFSYNPHIGYDLGTIQLELGYNAASKNGSTLSFLGLSGVYKF